MTTVPAITIVAITLLCAYIAYILRDWQKLKKHNQCPLKIKTFEGSNCPYHPSVVYFKDGWQGHRYWMIETPYKYKILPYRDRYECPSLHVSGNGIDWNEIAPNPIDDIDERGVEDLDYLSDPHLVFTGDKLECWYRLTKRHGIEDNRSDVYLLRKTTKDGISWSCREVIASLTENDKGLGNMIVSPAIIYKDNMYHMWYVDSESMGERHLAYSYSQDCNKWEKTICRLEGKHVNPWHIDVAYIQDKYFLVCYDFKDITLYESEDGISFKFTKTLLKPSVMGSFYGNGLYRASLIHDGEYKLYFGCDDIFNTYIGLMTGKEINRMKVKTIGSKDFRSLTRYIKYRFDVDKRHYCFIIKHLTKRILHI